MKKQKNHIVCAFCGKEIEEGEVIYVEGEPYCSDCYQEAEIDADIPD